MKVMTAYTNLGFVVSEVLTAVTWYFVVQYFLLVHECKNQGAVTVPQTPEHDLDRLLKRLYCCDCNHFRLAFKTKLYKFNFFSLLFYHVFNNNAASNVLTTVAKNSFQYLPELSVCTIT